MRVVVWNVRSLRDGAAGVAAVLRRLDPDLAVLQEAPRLLLWRSSRALLARRAGLRAAGRSRAAGNQLLVRAGTPVVRARGVLLPRRPRLHRRALAVAELLVEGRPLVLAGTHLDLDPLARLDSARRVRAALPAGALVLGADVNDEPASPTWAALADGLVDARAGCGPTFPARAPRRSIDALLVSPDLEVRSCEVADSGAASDHLPLVAELAWRAQPQ